MKSTLELGNTMSGTVLSLPLSFVTRTLAIIGIRGWGKTVAATVLAEEMCEAGLPWVAIDPVGVWWGLRCNPDGTPGGYPVLILGGPHGDLPIAKDAGARVADAILQEQISCVIDMSGESKNTVRHFVADFCDRLMELTPASPRHIFIEEAPELVPQKPMGEQKRSLAAVDRLIRLGRNRGYGATLISQRYATIQKDVLTQCENLLCGRMIGKTDRDAAEGWIAEVASALFSNRAADKFIAGLAALSPGRGWFLSPQWLDKFVEVQVRRRKTYHPGETRDFGVTPKQVQLSDVKEFVERFSRSQRASQQPKEKSAANDQRAFTGTRDALQTAQENNGGLLRENETLRGRVRELTVKLSVSLDVINGLRKQLEPQYRQLQALFGDIEKVSGNGSSHRDASVFEPWKQKLGSRCAQMIDALLDRGELTRTQLATLTGQSPRSGGYANNLSSLNKNGLLEKDGDKIRLREI